MIGLIISLAIYGSSDHQFVAFLVGTLLAWTALGAGARYGGRATKATLTFLGMSTTTLFLFFLVFISYRGENVDKVNIGARMVPAILYGAMAGVSWLAASINARHGKNENNEVVESTK